MFDNLTQGGWTVSTTVLILILAQAVVAIAALVVFVILALRKSAASNGKKSILVAREKAATPRNLVGITLDTSAVKRNFKLGEPFDSEGLVVVAEYDSEPTAETVYDYTVEAPMMAWEGSPSVTVRYGGLTAFYAIDIAADEERYAVGLELDCSAVRTQFTVGEAFESGGLSVYLRYNSQPYREEIFGYAVDAPATDTQGDKQVFVRYDGFVESYSVTVVAPQSEQEPQSEPQPEQESEQPEPQPAENALRYDRSFTARLIQSSDEVKQWYTLIKNELLSYRKVKDRTSWKRETYKCGGRVIALFGFRGNTLCLSLALNPADYDGSTRYKVEDVSANRSFAATPCMLRIKNDRRVKRANELIAEMMASLGVEKTDRIAQDYYLPYEGIVQLVNKGLAKRLLVTVQNFDDTARSAESEAAATVAADSNAAPVIVSVLSTQAVAGEDDVEGGTLRYDKSFRAKVIQADDEIKNYYSALKNELLSYGKVKDRLSWKRESFRQGGSVIARLAFRGKTLCLYLPLNSADYAQTAIKTEDVSANRSFADTPCMFRVKNGRRLRQATELIATVAEQRGIARNNRQPENYCEPYRDIVTLITEGLVRRDVQSAQEEPSFFAKRKSGESDD